MNKFSFWKDGVTEEQKKQFAKAVAGRIAVSAAIIGGFIGVDQIVSKVRQNRRRNSTVTVLFQPTVQQIDVAVQRNNSEHEYTFEFPEAVKEVLKNEALKEAGLLQNAIQQKLKESYEQAYPKSPDVVKVIHHSSEYVVIIK